LDFYIELKSEMVSQEFENLAEAAMFAQELETRHIPIDSIVKGLEYWNVKWSIAIHFDNFETFLKYIDAWDKEK